MCKSICEAILAIIILVFAIGFWAKDFSQWVIVISAVILLIHSFICKKCFVNNSIMPVKGKKR